MSNNQLSTKQEQDDKLVLRNMQQAKKTKTQRIIDILANVEAARGLVLEPDREEWFIHRLVTVDNISMDQLDRAELWLLRGNRTYMGDSGKKILYSDFYPDYVQLRSIAAATDVFFTAEMLAETCKKHYNNGYRDGRLYEMNKKNDKMLPVTTGDAVEAIGHSNLKLQLEVQTLSLNLASANARIKEYEEQQSKKTADAFIALFGVEPQEAVHE